jgi:hypothetical protein
MGVGTGKQGGEGNQSIKQSDNRSIDQSVNQSIGIVCVNAPRATRCLAIIVRARALGTGTHLALLVILLGGSAAAAGYWWLW